MTVRCVNTTTPSGSKIEKADEKYTFAAIAQHLSGVDQLLKKRIKTIENIEAKSWANARTRSVGR
jgi:hypothetical protein